MKSDYRTKIALLAHPDPQGLHPNELAWREFARWLVMRIDQGQTSEIQAAFTKEQRCIIATAEAKRKK